MAIHTMLDLETLGMSNAALILSIGAVKFDADNIIDRFHVGIDPRNSEKFGLRMDADTVMWWFKPEQDSARAALLDLPQVDLMAALDGFSDWTARTPRGERGGIFGNGAVMDNVKLKSSYTAAQLDYPFSYKSDLCYRTLWNLVPGIEVERVGTPHVAVDDAETQARHMQTICKHVGIQL